MYCLNCGTKLIHALSYCNHCGESLTITQRSDDKIDYTETTADTITWVIVGTTITILGMALGALVLMNQGSIDANLGRVFVILSFVAFLIVEGALVLRLLQLNKSNRQRRGLAQPKDLDKAVPNEVEARALRDPGEPVPSATEQTTRAFEPSYRNDQS